MEGPRGPRPFFSCVFNFVLKLHLVGGWGGGGGGGGETRAHLSEFSESAPVVWYILKQLFTSVSVKVVDIYLHFGE